MARNDFSKPFFMGSFAEKNYGPPPRRPMHRIEPPMMMQFDDDYGPMEFDRPYGPPRGFDEGFMGFRPEPAPLGFTRRPPNPMMGGGGNDMFMEPGLGYGGGPVNRLDYGGNAVGPLPHRGLPADMQPCFRRPAYEGIGFRREATNETRREAVTKFLLRCGVHETIIKQLPKDLIKMFAPDNCFLCSYKMESFLSARLHYTSRLHFSKVMKYLQDWSKRTGKSMPSIERQEPLKARNLYCELCDVAITSKPHAESHYLGKAHNAIVLGRKVPKNKALQKLDKADRLELLLRRERKQLNLRVKGKPDPPKPAAAPAAAPDPKPKDIQPDLYCETCNISVTCAEQLLSHMNGKKHLTREKNQILKFTKVDSLKKTGGATKNGTKTAEAAKNAEVENKNGEADKKEIKEEAMEVEKNTDEDKANGDKANGDKANGDKANEDEANEDKANEDKADEDKANEVKAAEDKVDEEKPDESWVHGSGEGWDNATKADGAKD